MGPQMPVDGEHEKDKHASSAKIYDDTKTLPHQEDEQQHISVNLTPTKAKDQNNGDKKSAAAAITSPSTLHQPLSLVQSCSRFISRRLELFTKRRYRNLAVPVDVFLRILKEASAWHNSADLIIQIVKNMPCLDGPELDQSYWKRICDHGVDGSNCPIIEPYDVTLVRVIEIKKALEAWEQRSKPANHQEEAVCRLKELKDVPISVTLLSESMIGEVISRLAKFEDASTVASIASKLKKTWKTHLKKDKEEEGQNAEAMSPVAIGRRSTQIKTWRQVYDFHQEYAKHRRETVGKRALEMREEHENKKHRTMGIHHHTKTEKSNTNSSRPQPGNTERIRKLCGMRPPVKPVVKPIGGINFLPSKKSKGRTSAHR